MPRPSDQPAGQQEAPKGLVLIDLGGWISGPCLDLEDLEPLAEGLPAWPVNDRERPTR